MTLGGNGTAGRTRLCGCGCCVGGVFIDPLWRDADILGIREILFVEGPIDDGDDGVPARLGLAKAVGREVNGFVEGDVVDNHSLHWNHQSVQFHSGMTRRA